MLIAYHSALDDKGKALAARFSDFLHEESVVTDTFQMLACEKPDDAGPEDDLAQMSVRYWTFFLIQLSRLQSMVSTYIFSCLTLRLFFMFFFQMSLDLFLR